MDYEALASQLLRALRANRSQTAFSRRLGYRTNVAYPWESGRRFPTAAETFRIARRLNVDVEAAAAQFFRPRLPDALEDADLAQPETVAALLREARGSVAIQALATRTGLSRSAVSRILSGKTEPRLPTFLRLVDAATRRVLDLLSGLVDVARLPAAAEEWRRLEAMRNLAPDNPLSEAVPRFLELEQYHALERHQPGWIAERLGISCEQEQRTLEDLRAAGVARFDGRRWQLDRARSVDTTRDPQAAAKLRAHWTERARARIEAQGEGLFSYLVFGADEPTLAAIEELRTRFFRELRALVRSAPEATRVLVTTVHLFPIDVGVLD
jgi:transcriptional regulator with XRE-family HTH domain